MRKIIVRRSAAILLLLGLTLAAVPAGAVTCRVAPNHVNIDLNYHGATLSVTGENQAGDDLIIRIGNQAGEAHYKYMGKAGGLFWMKKGDVTFKNVPGVYLLYSSRELGNLLDEAGLKANLIGYRALQEVTEMEAASSELQADESGWKNEFFRFKENQNLYAIHTGTVTRQHGQDNDTYQVEVAWPYQAPPGNYTVEVMAVRDGRVVERAEALFTVDRSGIVAWLSDLAFNKAALYGIMAVVIAIIAGFAVGMIFKKGGGAH
jgi:uncharacterized protein (TIGR02186 family)